MKRKEQIEKAATDYINSDAVSPMNMQTAFGDFINGAKWADKTMIEKFLYWLTMKSPFIDNKDMDKAIVELRKYMEE